MGADARSSPRATPHWQVSAEVASAELPSRVVTLAAAALVVVAVSVALVTASSSLSSAQIRQKIAQASALSSKAGTIRIDEIGTRNGVPTEHISRLVLPASGVSRLSYFGQTIPFT